MALISSGVLFVLMGFATLLYSLSSSQFRVVYEAPDDWYVGAGESHSAGSPWSCVYSSSAMPQSNPGKKQ